ncbi:hypothetical protein G3480_17770 [Thiorhodococcus mannitoliphagus]|uniref:Knr4/Smi1-like domain-containing protein n=1 Tax=Thiorhodococcus mannitoliphagus TaxID=329406 RepID=A0A6P1DYN5_9GAMM|nr:SMI1/KNR4 family protein [Thiorhodococcus mannitoliphagus]NEX22131.1 hypothetical protein [Thiorhodococcus mannitoliphagus]
MDHFPSGWVPFFVIAGITLLFALRLVLAARVAEWARFVAVPSIDIPPGWQQAFADTDAELRRLGFEHLCFCRTEFAPPETLTPELARFYRHGSEPVIARVLPPQVFAWPEGCGVAFFSLESSGTLLATVDRLPELFPRPPESLAMGIVTVARNLEDLLEAHHLIVAARQDNLVPWGGAEDVLARMNAFEVANIAWLRAERLIAPHPDGGYVPRLRTALGFIWRNLRGQVVQPRPESEPLKPDHAALLFQQWRKAQGLRPPPRVQWGLFILTALVFLIAGGILWDWLLTSLLLGAIVFHEFGHYLAMRWLGYRNLQILMLPLLGGLATGVERHPSAANRAFVSLMGPLPGILLGWLLLSLADGSAHQELMTILALVLLLINYLNLLPLVPLDGGQLVKALIPPRWLVVLVGFELLGAAALFWIGFQLDLMLSLIGLIPLFGAIALWRRRGRLRALQARCAKLAGPDDELERIKLAIDVEDAHKGRYRPLTKKAKALQDLLDTLSLKPPSSATRGLLLSLYLALFLVPLAVAPEFAAHWADLLVGTALPPTKIDRFREEARTLPWNALLAELDALQRAAYLKMVGNGKADDRPPVPETLLRAPANATAIVQAEQALGTALPPSYRAFLEVSNGLRDPFREDGGDWLLSVEDIGPMHQKLSAQLADIKAALAESERQGDAPVIWVSPGETFADAPKQIETSQLDNLLVVGMGGFYDAFILLSPDLAEAPGEMGVLELSQDLMATGYSSFRAFIESHEAIAKLRKRSSTTSPLSQRGARGDFGRHRSHREIIDGHFLRSRFPDADADADTDADLTRTQD